MKKSLLSAICLATMLSTSGAFALDLPVKAPSLPTASSSSSSFDKGASVAQIRNILAAQEMINTTFDASIQNLASIVLSKEDMAEIKAKKEELSKKMKNKEEGAIEAALVAEAAAKIAQATDQADMGAKIKNLDAAQKQLVADCTYNVLLAGLGYADIAANSLSLVNQIKANPTAAVALAADIKPLTNVVANMPKQVQLASQVTTGLIKVSKAGGVQIPQPASKTAKAKPVKANADWLN